MLGGASSDGVKGLAEILDLVRLWIILPSPEHCGCCSGTDKEEGE